MAAPRSGIPTSILVSLLVCAAIWLPARAASDDLAAAAVGSAQQEASAAEAPANALAVSSAAPAATRRPLDRIFLVDARRLGWRCPDSVDQFGWQEAVVSGDACQRRWVTSSFENFAAANDGLTIFYVHGNRISPGDAKARGLWVYRRLVACGETDAPIRFVVFSWPATQLRGAIRDARVKASLADQAGPHFAFILNRIVPETPVGVLGYSYGARVTGGALHILGGGRICGRGLAEDVTAQRSIRAVYWAAALDDDWLMPGRMHGKTISQLDSLLLVNNSCDPAMKFYHVSRKHGRPRAMGRFGVAGMYRLGSAAERIQQLDVCCSVGARHSLSRYLAATQAVHRTWAYLTFAPVR